MARERGRLQKELEAARAAGSEDEGLRDERDALGGRAAELEARVTELERELGSARTQRDEAAAALEEAKNAPVEPDDLIGMVGDAVAPVLHEAQETADQLQSATASDAQRTMNDARLDGERIRREAEQRALTIRRDAQETADAISAEARRDAEAVGREAEEAAALAREEASRDAEATRAEAEAGRREITQSAEDAARELREATDREVRRLRQEAEDTAAAQVKGAERLAKDMDDDAQTRTREIENRLEVDKEREERIIGQLADARELLTTHLAATQTGLQRVLTEVSEAAIPDLIEPGEAPVDEVPAGDDGAPDAEEPDGP